MPETGAHLTNTGKMLIEIMPITKLIRGLNTLRNLCKYTFSSKPGNCLVAYNASAMDFGKNA